MGGEGFLRSRPLSPDDLENQHYDQDEDGHADQRADDSLRAHRTDATTGQPGGCVGFERRREAWAGGSGVCLRLVAKFESWGLEFWLKMGTRILLAFE